MNTLNTVIHNCRHQVISIELSMTGYLKFCHLGISTYGLQPLDTESHVKNKQIYVHVPSSGCSTPLDCHVYL